MLHGIGRPTTGRLVSPGMYIESPAGPLVEQMEGETNPLARAAMAFQAIQLDYGCIPARLALAEYHAARPERRLHHLQVAVQTGDDLFHPAAVRHGANMPWWAAPGTQDYLRAIRGLGCCHLDQDREAEALRCFERLLEMDPGDHVDVASLAAIGMTPPRRR